MTEQLEAARKAAEQDDFHTAYAIWRPRAEAGIAEAQNAVGYCYLLGKVVDKDPLEALQWFHLAADQGNAKAQYNLGHCSINGYGMEKDPAAALHWFQCAADQGDNDAEYKLGLIYKIGPVDHRDKLRALFHLARATKRDHTRALSSLLGLLEGCADDEDATEAERWLKKLANLHRSEALQQLGVRFLAAMERTTETARATEHATTTNLHDCRQAACLAAEILAGDNHFEIDSQKERKLMTIACFEGSPAATRSLATMAKRGEGGAQDIPLVLRLLEGLVTYEEDVLAASVLGHIYLFGDGVEQDHAEAEKWLLEAGEGGEGLAQYHLGVLYTRGEADMRDPKKGQMWLQRAAQQGNKMAQRLLNYC